MRLVEWTHPPRYIDLSGVDEHTVRQLRVGCFGGVVKTQRGQAIMLCPQMAHMPDAKTILSSPQIEHFKNVVNEKSPHVTGKIPSITTLDGYVIPMEIRNGLPCVRVRPYTDSEWHKLPKFYMNADKEWDPRILNATVPDRWYEEFPNKGERAGSKLHDEHGEYRDQPEIPTFDDQTAEEEIEVDEKDPDNIKVSRHDIKVFLHNVVKDECDDVFMFYEAHGETYEHRINNFDKKYVFDARSRPRRDPRLNKYLAPKAAEELIQVKDKASVQKTKTPVQKTLKQRQKPNVSTDDEPVDDIRMDDVGEDPDGYNNKAKTMTGDHPATTGEQSYKGNAPRIVKPSKVNYDQYARHFPGISLETIKRTFGATTQYGRVGAFPGFSMKHRIKSPNPALSIPRRNEPVATDTIYGPKGIPAVANGSTAAQFFYGLKSKHRWIVGCGHSDKNFPKNLQDVIRKFGAMDTLVSDRAKAEVSQDVKDIMRSYFINDRQSEPHNKNQNPAERAWQDTQRKANVLLNWSGAPDKCWLLALIYVCYVMNHVANQGLNWRTPLEWLLGSTPDVTALLMFVFCEPVHYALEDHKIGKSVEALGRFVGFSENVGHAMTFLILTEDDQILHRSRVRSATKGGAFDNFKAKADAPNIRPTLPTRVVLGNEDAEAIEDVTKEAAKEPVPVVETVHEEETPTEPNDDAEELFPSGQANVSEVQHPDEGKGSHDMEASPDDEEKAKIPAPMYDEKTGWESHHDWIKRVLPYSAKDTVQEEDRKKALEPIDASGLLNRSFITNPDAEGEQLRAIIDRIEKTEEKTADRKETLFKFRAKAGDKVFEEVMTHGKMLEWCDRDLDKDDFYNFSAISGHRKDPKQSKKWQVRVEWESGESTWEPLSTIFNDDPVTVALYAQRNDMVKEWPQCKRYLKNTKTLGRMVNQARLRNFRNRPKYKFGVQVPRNHEEAMLIDAKNGDTRWADAEKLEMDQLFEYDSFKDLGKGAPVPEGYTKIHCHFVYDVKASGKFKSRFVAGGHMTDTPVDSIYSGVVSIPGIRMVTFLAELNKMELWATDIGNAYLESVTKEKVAFVAGTEFGEYAGHTFIILKAQYGLKSSGQRWHDKLFDVLEGMGFTPSKAEPDIWMRDMGDHYEYLAVYVDDLLIASKNPQKIIDSLLAKPHAFKLKGTGPVSYHLGNDFFRDEDGTLCVGPRKYIERMANQFEHLFGHEPKRNVLSPLEKNDHPELDETELLDEDGIRKYQSLIGTMQWCITLGRFDIATAVMTMSGFRVAPRQGHLERLKRICGYLYKMKHGHIRVRTNEPDYSDLLHHQYDWSRTVYRDAKEMVPDDAPEPKGKRVVCTTYKDANLYHDMVTGKAVTGILHFLNQTPVEWFSKKQATVETATYGSEFTAAKLAVQQITALRTALRYLGVPIHGATVLFGDNESVVKSGSLPHSVLHKRWHGLSYHYTREAVASGMISLHHIPGEINPSDVLSKHWGYSNIWTQLQPILFWRGDTAKLIPTKEQADDRKGSNKISMSSD